jgi:hypothetical protein
MSIFGLSSWSEVLAGRAFCTGEGFGECACGRLEFEYLVVVRRQRERETGRRVGRLSVCCVVSRAIAVDGRGPG